MTHSTLVEQVIEVASRLKESAAGLYDAYGQMPAVIEREHRSIRAHDFFAVEASRVEKEGVAERIEEYFYALTQAGAKLGQLKASVTGTEVTRPVTLSECVAAMEAISAALQGDDLASQVLKHLTAGLKQQSDDLLARHREVKPLVEANRHLCTTMLRNFQESYRFWCEVSEQIAVSYNSNGVQQAAGRNSGFKARA